MFHFDRNLLISNKQMRKNRNTVEIDILCYIKLINYLTIMSRSEDYGSDGSTSVATNQNPTCQSMVIANFK